MLTCTICGRTCNGIDLFQVVFGMRGSMFCCGACAHEFREGRVTLHGL